LTICILLLTIIALVVAVGVSVGFLLNETIEVLLFFDPIGNILYAP
jgi:hypothetical protein